MLITALAGQPFPVAGLLRVSGEVDSPERDELRDAIVACGAPGTRVVVLDLSGVTYMGSSGLSALLSAREQLLDRNIRLCVDQCSDIVARLLDLTGVRDYLGRSTDPLATD